MKEIFKTIDEYPDYQVSNLGNVKSLERKVLNRNGYRTVRERILKARTMANGYQQVTLCRDGNIKGMLVHRLVACAFISNPNNLPEVNHIDENKSNNNVENLEWCTAKYNINYGTRNERDAKAKTGVYNIKTSKPVKCLETGIVYPSTNEVQRQLGFAQQNISKCCNGKYKQAYGYHWEYC